MAQEGGRCGPGSRPAGRAGHRHWPGAAGRARPHPPPPPPPALRQAGTGEPALPPAGEGTEGEVRLTQKTLWGWEVCGGSKRGVEKPPAAAALGQQESDPRALRSPGRGLSQPGCPAGIGT